MRTFRFLIPIFICVLLPFNGALALQEGEALGEKKYAIVLLDYAQDGSAPTVDTLRTGFFTSEYSIQKYIDIVSYGRTAFTGQFFGWIKPKTPLYGEGWTACWPDDKARFNILLENYPNIDLTAFDGFIFYLNRPEKSDCGGGVANTYGREQRPTYAKPEWVNTRIFYLSVPFYFPNDYSGTTNSTIFHELIHSLGISNHSSAIVCPRDVIVKWLSGCEIQAYGDIFSAMGLRSHGSHPNAIDKERLGWLGPSQLTTVNTPGRYTLGALELKTQGVKALKVSLNNPIPLTDSLAIDTLYIEYRAMTDFNSRNDFFKTIRLKNGKKRYMNNIHGALIYGADCRSKGYCMPYLLNMHPGSVDAEYPPNRLTNAFLFKNETFHVPYNNLNIGVQSIEEGQSITIKVDM